MPNHIQSRCFNDSKRRKLCTLRREIRKCYDVCWCLKRDLERYRERGWCNKLFRAMSKFILLILITDNVISSILMYIALAKYAIVKRTHNIYSSEAVTNCHMQVVHPYTLYVANRTCIDFYLIYLNSIELMEILRILRYLSMQCFFFISFRSYPKWSAIQYGLMNSQPIAFDGIPIYICSSACRCMS